VADGAAAVTEIEARPPDIAILDIDMPGLSGYDVCRCIKSSPNTRFIPVVLVTGLDDKQSRLHGIYAGADDYLMKPVDRFELLARVRTLLRNKSYIDELDSAEAVIFSLALTIEARDPCTEEHCQRLAMYAIDLGRQLGMGVEDLDALRKGGYVHDIGKVGIPDAILLKQGPLTADEWAVMKRHPLIGDGLCGKLRSLAAVRPIVRHHHERLNGTGYPDGLKGDGIPLLAQVIGIVDTFDALTHDRPYRPGWSTDRALEQLRLEVSMGWRNTSLVSAFATLVESGAFDSRLETQPSPGDQR
jgi:putative two-component system response regulator